MEFSPPRISLGLETVRHLNLSLSRADGFFAVAGRTILPSIISGLNSIVNSSNPLKFVYEAISYKPFLSLFNMTGAAEMNPQLAGIGELSEYISLGI